MAESIDYRRERARGESFTSRLARLADLRTLVYLTALAVAGFAFAVSYTHIYDLGAAHAQYGAADRMLPLSVDLLIVAASLVLFIRSQGGQPDTFLARILPRAVLWAGIGATVGANVAYGLPHGWLAAVISGWPGAAFVGVVEMITHSVRPRSRAAAASVPVTAVTAGQAPVPASAYEAARIAFAASVAAGNPLTPYKLHKQFGVSRRTADKIAALAVPVPSANGSGPGA